MNKKFTHEEAVAVLKQYAKNLDRFYEGSHSDKSLMIVGMILPGNFGIGDDFFDAMRALRKPPSRAMKQSLKRKEAK